MSRTEKVLEDIESSTAPLLEEIQNVLTQIAALPTALHAPSSGALNSGPLLPNAVTSYSFKESSNTNVNIERSVSQENERTPGGYTCFFFNMNASYYILEFLLYLLTITV